MRICTFVLVVVATLLFAAESTAQSRRFGLVEVGGSGVKASVVELETAATGEADLDVVGELAPENVNPIFPENIGVVSAAVSDLVQTIHARYEVPAARIYVVGSSGVEQTAHASLLREAIDAAVARRAGAMTYIAADAQARLGFEGVINCERLAHRRMQALFLDIGSSSVSGAVATARGRAACGDEEIEAIDFGWGVKVIARAGEEPGASVPALVAARLDAALAQAPSATRERDRIYLGGGVVWALATFTHPDDGSRFVRLHARDIEALRAQLADNPACVLDEAFALRPDPDCRYLDVDYSLVADEQRRMRAIADHREIVQSVFTPQQMRAGAEVLAALSERLNFSDKPIFFARLSVNAWVLGYLLRQEAAVRR